MLNLHLLTKAPGMSGRMLVRSIQVPLTPALFKRIPSFVVTEGEIKYRIEDSWFDLTTEEMFVYCNAKINNGEKGADEMIKKLLAVGWKQVQDNEKVKLNEVDRDS